LNVRSELLRYGGSDQRRVEVDAGSSRIFSEDSEKLIIHYP
jgi:hypothetical protein